MKMVSKARQMSMDIFERSYKHGKQNKDQWIFYKTTP